MTITKGTTTNTHADDSALGTVYNYEDSDGYKLLLDGQSFTGTFTVKDALDLISYSSIAGDTYASETAYGYTRLASEADMDLVTVNGGADNITDAVTVKQLQYWVNEVAPATTTTRGFVKLAATSELDRDSTSGGVVTVGSLNTFLNSPGNAGSADKAGALQIATVAEANAGTNTTKAITPQALRQIVDSAIGQSNDVVATETVLGNVKLATSSESIAGNNNTDALTPSTNKSAFDSWIDDWWTANDNSLAITNIINTFIGQETNYPSLLSGTPNSYWVKKNGSVLARATYPNLWAWVESKSEILVTESEWQSLKSQSPTDAVSVYSSGDGSTTFRVPSVGIQSGFAKSIAIDENIDSTSASIGFLSNNKVHTHTTNTAGNHIHSETPHTHSASFTGNALPEHYHNARAGNNDSWRGQSRSLVYNYDDHETVVGPDRFGNKPVLPVSAGIPSGSVNVGYAQSSTDYAGSHTHTLSNSGQEQGNPVGFYVQTFIFAGSTDTTTVPINTDWQSQLDANTVAIADLANATSSPIGAIIAFDSADSIPNGWALCDGTNGTPDLRGRFLVGQDPNQTDYGAMNFTQKGKYGGRIKYVHTHSADVKGHTLTWEQIPPHKHTSGWGEGYKEGFFGEDMRQGNRGFGVAGPKDYDNYKYLTSDYIINPNSTDGYSYRTSARSHDHDIVLGSDTEYIAPPYYVIVWIKRIA